MLKPESPQESFFGSYLYDRIVPIDHLLRKINQVVADLVRYCGLRRCRYRGLGRAGIHTLLATIACNIKRMAKLLWGKPDSYYFESTVAG